MCPKKLIIIYNSPSPLQTAIEPLEIKRGGKTTVFYAGVLTLNRGFEYLIPAIAALPNTELLIGGFGADEALVRQLIGKYPQAKFLGRLPYRQVLELSRKSDILVALYDPTVPNHHYSSPNKLFEAMLLSKPIIVSDGTGMSDIVRRISNGLVVPYGDFRALQEAVTELSDTSTRLKMGQRGKEAYRHQYGWPIMAERLRQLYRSLTKSVG